MARRSWSVARLEEVPPAGLASDLSYWQQWARDPQYGRRWHSVRHHFGIKGFGVNANKASAGEELVVPHDETDFGGQKIYLIMRGRARCLCDGQEVELREGELLVRPEVQREATALETPTVVFMVGGIPREPYKPWPGD